MTSKLKTNKQKQTKTSVPTSVEFPITAKKNQVGLRIDKSSVSLDLFWAAFVASTMKIFR